MMQAYYIISKFQQIQPIFNREKKVWTLHWKAKEITIWYLYKERCNRNHATPPTTRLSKGYGRTCWSLSTSVNIKGKKHKGRYRHQHPDVTMPERQQLELRSDQNLQLCQKVWVSCRGLLIQMRFSLHAYCNHISKSNKKCVFCKKEHAQTKYLICNAKH